MSQDRTTATALVTLTIEMPAAGSWGPDCPMSQVYDQAKESAERMLYAKCKDLGVRIIKSDVTTILTKRPDR